MKVQIRDRDALESLSTTNLQAYLESHGWTDTRPWGKWTIIHSKERNGKLWEISVPLRDGGATYAEFMAMAVTTLAEAEDRSQLDVFHDLANQRVETAPLGGYEDGGTMVNVWRVGADKGDYTDHFVDGGYAAAGWLRDTDLTGVTDKKEFYRLFWEENTDGVPAKIAAGVGAIRKFIVDIKPGDYIITPTADNALQRYGRVESSPYYYVRTPTDGCPFPHRRKVAWADQPVNIADFSRPLHNALKFGVLAVFNVHHREEFLTVIGPHRAMLDELLKIDETEFEMLIGTALKHKGWKIAK